LHATPLNAEVNRAYPFAPIEQTLTGMDCMLYALSVSGATAHALMNHVGRESSLRSTEARFTPVLPGGTIQTEFRKTSSGVAFEARVVGRVSWYWTEDLRHSTDKSRLP